MWRGGVEEKKRKKPAFHFSDIINGISGCTFLKMKKWKEGQIWGKEQELISCWEFVYPAIIGGNLSFLLLLYPSRHVLCPKQAYGCQCVYDLCVYTLTHTHKHTHTLKKFYEMVVFYHTIIYLEFFT